MCNYPLISVLIPTYNVSDWIEDAIMSILNQTYSNIEIVIIDDCSTDDTFEKLLSLSKKDDRITLLRNDVNLKITKTLNRGLDYVKGDYIARFDGDDIATNDRIEKQFSYMIEKDLDLVGCQMIAIDQNGNVLRKGNSPVGEGSIKTISNWASPIAHIWLAKRSVYEKIGGYRDIPYAEDYDFILRALDRGFKCDNHIEHLMYIRHRTGNSASMASLTQRKSHNYVLKLHRERARLGGDCDSYDVAKMHNVLASSALGLKLHKLSSFFLFRALQQNSKLKKIFYILFSSVTSIYNMQYLFRRSIVYIILLRNGKNNVK